MCSSPSRWPVPGPSAGTIPHTSPRPKPAPSPARCWPRICRATPCPESTKAISQEVTEETEGRTATLRSLRCLLCPALEFGNQRLLLRRVPEHPAQNIGQELAAVVVRVVAVA